MIFRLSQKLAKKIKVGNLSDMPPAENQYADWSCRLFTADRIQFVILTNTPTLFSCLMFGKGITNESLFTEQAFGTIRDFMECHRQQTAYETFVAPGASTVRFANALNRSVTGSMNEPVHRAKWHLWRGVFPQEVGFYLNDTPLAALGYAKPRERFKAMAASGGPSGIAKG